jgi:predicted small lipoprotein YifL
VPGFCKFPTALLFAATLLAGCGLKGPLELPEQPSNMVIRPAPGTAPANTTQAPASGSTAPATPAVGPATAPPAPAPAEPDERPPPPQLPRGQRGGAS